jgi:hypothetical protein
MLEAQEKKSFRSLVTGDENRLILEYEHETRQFMFLVVWVSRGELDKISM